MSTASTAAAPQHFAAAIASTPVPLPASRPRRPRRSSSSSASVIRYVVAWWPVPNDMRGMMTTSADASAAGAWNGARISSRPSMSTGWKSLSHAAFQLQSSMVR